MVTTTVSPAQLRLAQLLCSDPRLEAVRRRLAGDPEPLADSLELTRRLHERGMEFSRQLRAGLPVPVIPIPLDTSSRSGLAMARTVAAALDGDAA
jgi:hypothetical protein